MKDINIKIEKATSKVFLNTKTLGIDGENLQGNLIFSFVDTFVDGQGRLEYAINGNKAYQILTKEEETYKLPIKSVLTKKGQIDMQLVISEGIEEDEIPIFKSNVFYVFCNSSINAEIEEVEEYPTWIEIANTKLNQMDNFDIEATKQDNVATITLTNRFGNVESVEIFDGEQGIQGEPGKDGIDGKTPVKGEDYFTEADKQELVDLVLAEIPSSEEVSY